MNVMPMHFFKVMSASKWKYGQNLIDYKEGN